MKEKITLYELKDYIVPKEEISLKNLSEGGHVFRLNLIARDDLVFNDIKKYAIELFNEFDDVKFDNQRRHLYFTCITTERLVYQFNEEVCKRRCR